MLELVVIPPNTDDVPPIILETSHYLLTVHAYSIHTVCINTNNYRGVGFKSGLPLLSCNLRIKHQGYGGTFDGLHQSDIT